MADIDLMNPQDQALGALGSAFQGFAKGMMDAEDRNYKKLEMDAKFKAQDEERSRNAYAQAMEQKKFEQTQSQFEYQKEKDKETQDAALYEKGVAKDPVTGALVARPLTEQEKAKNALNEFDKGAKVKYGPNGEFLGVEMDKASKKALELEARIAANKAAADARRERLDIQRDRLDEIKNKNAVQAGHDFEADKIISTSKMNINSLNRSQSILDNPNKPVTTKDLNLAYTDYINAVAAGGAATEGKINRELPETFDLWWNVAKQKAGENDDLRKTTGGAQMIAMLKENIKTVNHDLKTAQAEQAFNLHNNYVQNTNPKVQETVRQKLLLYAPEKYAELYPSSGGQTPSGLLTSGLVSKPDGLVGQQQQPPAGKIRVSNGSETLLIPAGDLKEAEKDGYKRVSQ